MRDKIVDAFAVLGIMFVAVIGISIVHELGHVFNAQRKGYEVQQVCVLGWDKDMTNIGNPFIEGTAWVKRTGGADRFDKWWDFGHE